MYVLKSGQGITTGNMQWSLFWYNTIYDVYKFDLKGLWTGYVFDIVYMKWIDDTERIGSKDRKNTAKLILVQHCNGYDLDLLWK